MASSDYHDRGMKKWGGFLLSEHTAKMEAESRLPTWEKPMDQESIYRVLHQVIQHRAVAVIQLYKEEEEVPDAYIEGRIVAVEGDWLHVQVGNTVQVIDLEMIRFVKERGYQKWYEK
ncbi:hypothetical protein HB816_00955 [Listeria booriae]|uniref:hypothetical protein n=1 Tax=Listeria booriae TaxID=1552123 RepID=UPI00162403BB|nr:hypothetical protein [Listeria booriae]MBC1209744.1 hypothetical protein [Listeria booriae]MBC1229019.1 hypothetical protein [Listeria booriae]